SPLIGRHRLGLVAFADTDTAFVFIGRIQIRKLNLLNGCLQSIGPNMAQHERQAACSARRQLSVSQIRYGLFHTSCSDCPDIFAPQGVSGLLLAQTISVDWYSTAAKSGNRQP